MYDSHFFKRALGQTLMTLTFGLTCFAVSAFILASAPPAGAPPADRQPSRAGGQHIVPPTIDLRLATADDRWQSAKNKAAK